MSSVETLGQEQSLQERVQNFVTSRLPVLGSIGVAAFGVAGMKPGSVEAASGAHDPIQPSSLLPSVNLYAEHMVPDSGLHINIRTAVIKGHYLLRTTACAKNDSLQEIRDNLKGAYGVPCPWLHESPVFIARQRMVASGYGEPSMDFQPLLTKIGDEATESIKAKHPHWVYGTAKKAVITSDPAERTSELVIKFGKLSAHTATSKEIKQLKISVSSGKKHVSGKQY